MAHTVTVCDLLYTVTVKRFGQLDALARLPYSADASVLFSGIIAFAVQVD